MFQGCPQSFEIWRLEFQYDDQPNKTKARPVIIGGVDKDTFLVLAVKVTGHPPRREFPGEVELLDWQEEGLLKPSTARCSKVMKVPAAHFAKCKKYGKLTLRDEIRVRKALTDIGYLSA